MKHFVVSDIHSFYDELTEALKVSGYDKKNPDHMLIVAGDIFDRGPKTKEVYKFLKSIPKKRRVLVRGNHEMLFIDLLKKSFPESYDFSNKTVRAFCQLAGYDEACLNTPAFVDSKANWDQIVKIVQEMAIGEWFMSKDWVDYYEFDRFIVVHSFIPVRAVDVGYFYEYNPNWRTSATKEDWDRAVWGSPWGNYRDGLFKQEEINGKTLICGHWHTSDFFKFLRPDLHHIGYSDIFYSKGLIGIDGGVYRTENGYYHPCNVLVIEDGICYDKNGNKLEEPKKIFTELESSVELPV